MKNGPLTTPFENPLVSTPAPSEGTLAGLTGGYEMSQGAGDKGLVTSPFEKPLTTGPDGQKETPNMSELPLQITDMGGIQNAPARGSTVEIAGGVTTPNTPAGNIDKK